MNTRLSKMVIRLLGETMDKISTGTCEMTEEEAMDIIAAISHQVMSKEQACEYLNIGRSRFDELVRLGQLPKGRKRKGFKELVWYKDELDYYCKEVMKRS